MPLHEGLRNTWANGLSGDYALCRTSWGITHSNRRSGYCVDIRVNRIKQIKIENETPIFEQDIYCKGEFRNPSDERIKTNIQPLDDNESLNIIKQLNQCKYEYVDKQDGGSNTVIGSIGQDVEKAYPQPIKIMKEYITSHVGNVTIETSNICTSNVNGFIQGDKLNFITIITANKKKIAVAWSRTARQHQTAGPWGVPR